MTGRLASAETVNQSAYVCPFQHLSLRVMDLGGTVKFKAPRDGSKTPRRVLQAL